MGRYLGFFGMIENVSDVICEWASLKARLSCRSWPSSNGFEQLNGGGDSFTLFGSLRCAAG
jgi:hypothetical protein